MDRTGTGPSPRTRPPETAKRRERAERSRRFCVINGAPVGIRTPNLLIRSQMLYPVELRVRGHCAARLCAAQWKGDLSKQAGLLQMFFREWWQGAGSARVSKAVRNVRAGHRPPAAAWQGAQEARGQDL